MAKLETISPFILSWEGGYTTGDGGTNKGVTIATWKAYGYDLNGDNVIDENDIKLVSEEDATYIMKKCFWDRINGDKINSQSVANIIMDWVWNSGLGVVKKIQTILKVKPDGIIGPKTIEVINSSNSKNLFEAIKSERLSHLQNIVINNPKKRKFLLGWNNRVNSIEYNSLRLTNGETIHFT